MSHVIGQYSDNKLLSLFLKLMYFDYCDNFLVDRGR